MRPFHASLLSRLATQRFRQRQLKPLPFGGVSSARPILSSPTAACGCGCLSSAQRRLPHLDILVDGLLGELDRHLDYP